MEKTYTQLTVSRRAKGDYSMHPAGREKYAVSSGVYGYDGFKTDKEFSDWLTRMNLTTTQIDGSTDTDEWGYFTIGGFIIERLFWDLSEIPIKADMFVGLSNGSEVHCFSLPVDGGTLVWRPNPNAKEVYRGFSIAEYAKFKRGDYLK